MKASEHLTKLRQPSIHLRSAILIAQGPSASKLPISQDADAVLALLPDGGAEIPEPLAQPSYDNRAWLSAAAPEPTIIEGKCGSGKANFGEPPAGLTRLEGLLFREMGAASARASVFLSNYLKFHRFNLACDAANCTFDWVGMARVASSTFATLYTAVCCAVRQGRAEKIEDAMFARATGEHRALETKVIEGADGIEKRITTDGGAIYDTKAAALLLPGYKPEVFAPRTQGPGGVSISINVAVAAPAAPATVRRDAKEAVEAEVIALCPRPQPSDEVVV